MFRFENSRDFRQIRHIKKGCFVSLMGRKCTLCSHSRRGLLEEAIVQGVPFRTIARGFGVSPAAISRHLNTHVREELERLMRERLKGRPSDPESGFASDFNEAFVLDFGDDLAGIDFGDDDLAMLRDLDSDEIERGER